MDKSAKKDIQKIVVLLSCAIATAFLIVGVMLHRYSPTGRYIAGQAILDPQVMDQINVKSTEKKRGQAGLVFEKTTFSFYDSKLKIERQIPVGINTYRSFYRLIENEKSLDPVDSRVKALFIQPHLSTVSTMMRESQESTAKRFQVIQFTPADYYRVQLHGDQNTDEWAYFYHAGVYNEVIKLFNQG